MTNLMQSFLTYLFYVLLTVQHLDAILGNDQLDALFLDVFILCFVGRAAQNITEQKPATIFIFRRTVRLETKGSVNFRSLS
jgi:hypothetical protein